jgi:outer membrane protein OmpA-like peptidoglycan-associated protein
MILSKIQNTAAVWSFIIGMLVFDTAIFAQKREIQEADSYFDEYLFVEAIQKYSEALTKPINEKTEIYTLSQIARCYQYSFNYTPAEYYFGILVEKTQEKRAEFLLEHAIMLKFNGKYEAAKEQFRKYQKLTENQDPYGSFQLRSVNWAIANDTVYKPVLIKATDLDISGQSLGYAVFRNGLIYAHARNKTPYYSMPIFSLDFADRLDSIKFVQESKYFDSIDFKGNEGFPSISKGSNRLYFAANSNLSRGSKTKKIGGGKQNVLNFKIYEAQLLDNHFGNVKELAFNSVDYNCTHPFISDDGNSIYFASDMPGGFGGYDLYVSKRDKNGEWGKPQNLGKSINSEENEMYPFIYKSNFYYSSKGLNGYGGYDIYVATVNKVGIPAGPKNLGKPYNSYRDDFAFICFDDGLVGYLSSNRGNDDGEDEVFYFREYPAEKGAEMKAVNYLQDSMQRAIAIQQKAKQEVLKKEIENKLEIAKNDRESSPVEITHPTVVPPIIPTIPSHESDIKIETKKPDLAPKAEELIVPTKIDDAINNNNDVDKEDDDDALLKMVFNNVNFGFNESKLVPEVLYILDSAAATIRMGNQIRIEVQAHTDSRGTSNYNKELSLKRATEARNYLLSKGVPASKIIIRGHGEDKLLNHCKDGVECSEEEHAANRRVELKIVR